MVTTHQELTLPQPGSSAVQCRNARRELRACAHRDARPSRFPECRVPEVAAFRGSLGLCLARALFVTGKEEDAAGCPSPRGPFEDAVMGAVAVGADQSVAEVDVPPTPLWTLRFLSSHGCGAVRGKEKGREKRAGGRWSLIFVLCQ